MRAKRHFTLLGPGLVASLVLSPCLTTQASAALSAPQGALSGVVAESKVDDPDPNGPTSYKQGWKEGYILGIKVGQQDQKAKNKRDPRRLSPYSRGTTELSKGRWDGFVAGYYKGVLVVDPFGLTDEMNRSQKEREEQAKQKEDEEDARQADERIRNAPSDEGEEEPGDAPADEPGHAPADEPASPPDTGHEQQPGSGHEQQSGSGHEQQSGSGHEQQSGSGQ